MFSRLVNLFHCRLELLEGFVNFLGPTFRYEHDRANYVITLFVKDQRPLCFDTLDIDEVRLGCHGNAVHVSRFAT